MNKLHNFLFIYLASQSLWAQTQTGLIQGKILNSDNLPVQQVIITLQGTNFSTVSDTNGVFFLKAPIGNYVIVVSMVGSSTQQQNIEVKPEQTTFVKFTLSKNSEELQEIIINSKKATITNKETEYVARMPLKNLENPQVYNVVSKEFLQQTTTIDYKNALLFVPGVAIPVQNAAGRNFTWIRGFNTSNSFRNGLVSYQYAGNDLANIERVEIIKGPTGTLFGTGGLPGYGGLINRVTKKPQTNTFIEVGYTGGSWGLGRFTLDVNTPLNKEQKLLLRVNSAYQRQNTWQDYGKSTTFLFAPVVSYQVNDRLQLLADVEVYHTRSTPDNLLIPTSGVAGLGFKDLNLNYDYSFNSDDAIYINKISNIFLRADYLINPQWTSTTTVNYARNEQLGNYFLSFINSVDSIERYVGYGDYSLHNHHIQQNFTGIFNITSQISNKLLMGIDYYYFQGRYAGIETPIDQFGIHDPGPSISNSKIQDTLASKLLDYNEINTESYVGAYVSDVVSVSNRFHAMLSLRLDRFENPGVKNRISGQKSDYFSQWALSPKFGATYEVLKNQVAAFVNFTHGFINENGRNRMGERFKPEQAMQVEGGFKAELFNKKITATASYYDIEVVNKVRQDPEDPNFSIQNGTVNSRGAELELIGEPIQNLTLLAGYAYNETKITKSDENTEGNRLGRAPKHLASAWINYRLTQGAALQGLGAGIGFNYGSETFTNDANTFRSPEYQIWSSTIFYETKTFRLTLKGDNLTNQKYWNGNGQSLAPRRLLASVLFKF